MQFALFKVGGGWKRYTNINNEYTDGDNKCDYAICTVQRGWGNRNGERI